VLDERDSQHPAVAEELEAPGLLAVAEDRVVHRGGRKRDLVGENYAALGVQLRTRRGRPHGFDIARPDEMRHDQVLSTWCCCDWQHREWSFFLGGAGRGLSMAIQMTTCRAVRVENAGCEPHRR